MENKGLILGSLAIIGLVAVILAMTLNATDTDNTMTVSGNSELQVSPDKATIFLTVTTEDAEASKAQGDNREKALAVIEALKTAGIAEKDIETSNYNLYRKQEWNSKTDQVEEKEYVLAHTLKVTTTDFANTGKYVDAAIKAGANGVERIDFGLSKDAETKYKAESLAKATESAKTKAENLASNAGVKLDDISSITENEYNYNPYEFYGNNLAVKADSSNQVLPQKVSVSTSVTIVYEIKQ